MISRMNALANEYEEEQLLPVILPNITEQQSAEVEDEVRDLEGSPEEVLAEKA